MIELNPTQITTISRFEKWSRSWKEIPRERGDAEDQERGKINFSTLAAHGTTINVELDFTDALNCDYSWKFQSNGSTDIMEGRAFVEATQTPGLYYLIPMAFCNDERWKLTTNDFTQPDLYRDPGITEGTI